MAVKLKGSGGYITKLALILLAITVVVALLLGLVNYITADRIAEINEQKTKDAMGEVLPADSYEPLDTGGFAGVAAAYRAVADGETMGYVIETLPSGFGGSIDMVVGVGTDGTVTGVSIISMSETAGLGANAAKEQFRSQYVGGSGIFAVDKDGGDIDSLTGATITSRAVTNGVNTALSFFSSIQG